MKQVDLLKILKSKETYDKEYPTVSINDALEAMKEACNQTVDLCAENAKIGIRSNYGRFEDSSPDKSDFYEVKDFIRKNTPGHGDCTYEIIYPDLQSILDTKKQII